jgi:hypothetical protein
MDVKNKIVAIFFASIILLSVCSSCSPYDSPTQEPAYIYAIDVINKYDHGLADYIKEQPWFKDGIDDEETMFLDYDLRRVLTLQAAYELPSQNEELRQVVANKLYKIEPIQLKKGTVYLLVISDIPDMIESVLRVLKAGAPIAESFLGITYPEDYITAFIDDNSSDSYGNRGTLLLGIGQSSVPVDPGEHLITDLHELVHAMWGSGKTTYLNDTKQWIDEGMAEFGAYYILQQISISTPRWFSWDGSVEKGYSYYLAYAQRNGIWNRPITSLKLSDPFGAMVVGYLFLKDLHDLMGNDSFSKTLVNLYIYKQPFRKVVIEEKRLESEALQITNNNGNIQDLFNVRIWGK